MTDGVQNSHPRTSPHAGANAQKHLLIVDDEPVILQILKAVFEDEAYRLTTAGSGAEALKILQGEGCDLLITDKNLPDVSGMELLKIAKEKNPFTEVIIVTGYASLETALTALELDAFDYILKPLNNVFDIKKKVKQALEKQEISLENKRLLEHLQDKNAELEAALAEAHELQAELIQSEKLAGIGTLAAGIAHEISSPLFGIMGLAEAITDEADPSLVKEYAGDIVEYCRNIRDIVVELSSYSRAAQTEYLTTVELPRVIEDALRLVERSSPVDGVAFETDLEEGLYVHARTNEVQQVFVNLIRNAAEAVIDRFASPSKQGGSKHGASTKEGEAEHGSARMAGTVRKGGTVRIEAGRGEGFVWARVTDNGVGIPEDKLGVVFDPFYTTKPPGKGTGLGLNVVYRILTKYRGNITVDSKVGEGTVFYLKIPLQS